MQPRLSHEDLAGPAPGAHAGLTALAVAVHESALERSLNDLSPSGALNKAHAALADHFSGSEAMLPSVPIAAINGWNRLGRALRFAPPPFRAQGE